MNEKPLSESAGEIKRPIKKKYIRLVGIGEIKQIT